MKFINIEEKEEKLYALVFKKWNIEEGGGIRNKLIKEKK